jgi:hypothetical protein
MIDTNSHDPVEECAALLIYDGRVYCEECGRYMGKGSEAAIQTIFFCTSTCRQQHEEFHHREILSE